MKAKCCLYYISKFNYIYLDFHDNNCFYGKVSLSEKLVIQYKSEFYKTIIL